MVREVGFYWVRVYEREGYTIGHYDGDDIYPWQIVGSDCTFEEGEIVAIGDKIGHSAPQ